MDLQEPQNESRKAGSSPQRNTRTPEAGSLKKSMFHLLHKFAMIDTKLYKIKEIGWSNFIRFSFPDKR
jgi:hypothetical protein